MGSKVKQASTKVAKATKASPVKDAGVTKSKKVAKEVAVKSSGKDKKKSKKVESESESSESEEEEEEESDASGSDSDSSESSEEEKPAPKAAKAKTNGKAAAAPATNGKAKKAEAKKVEESSDSDSDSDEEEDSNSESDKDALKKAATATAKAQKVTKESSDSDSDSDDDSDDDDEEAEDSDDSDDSDESEEEKKTEAPSKKRKADDEESAPAKKAKSDGSEPTTLFVGNLGWGVNDDILYDTFKDCEGIENARVVTDRQMQRSKGFGYVDFNSHEACKAAHEKMQGYELEGRAMNIDFSQPRPANDDAGARAANRAQQHGDTTSPESDTLFVGNLPFEADEEVVTAFFSDAAEVKNLRLPTDQESGNRKGFGYVTFNSIEDAKSAFEAKNGAYIGEGRSSRAVRLDFASQRPPREGGFGGGRGGGGRGGGRGGFGGRGGGRGGGGGFGGRGGGGRGGGRGGGFGGGRGGGGFQGKKITF